MRDTTANLPTALVLRSFRRRRSVSVSTRSWAMLEVVVGCDSFWMFAEGCGRSRKENWAEDINKRAPHDIRRVGIRSKAEACKPIHILTRPKTSWRLLDELLDLRLTSSFFLHVCSKVGTCQKNVCLLFFHTTTIINPLLSPHLRLVPLQSLSPCPITPHEILQQRGI